MPYRGTYEDNKRPVIATAPDCLVFLNGQLALPSGGNPTKKVNIQPYVTGVSCTLGIENSPGNASVSLHIPRHATDDFFRGGQLILTTMMEVRIYIKGHFLVGGAPRYYPAFWGVVTSVNHQWSGGERTVDLACQDILYWWTIQRININPSYQGAKTTTQSKFNVKGSGVFTGNNPYDVIYSLSRYAYGDAVNANIFLRGRQQRTEPNQQENLQLMAYWTRQWGRIAYALRMYGPNGEIIQGNTLAALLSKENRQAAFLGRSGTTARNRSQKAGGFKQLDVDLTKISAFSEVASRIGSFDLFTSEFQTKKEIADTAKTAIGYELFMDVTGEIVFKPPFYNLDVIPNKPVSWIRPIDIISESYAENPPDVTFLEGTGNAVRNLQIGEAEVVKPRATYVDYRLVAKYGWKPGSYNSEFFGAGLGVNASRNLFFHLVDELDRQNARVHTSQITIPIRPELRLGYPVYVESQDAYYYVEGISHNFSFAGNCTTSLTLMARRTKFYAAFPFWNRTLNTEGQERDQSQLNSVPGDNPEAQASPGETTNPNLYPTNLYARPIDPLSGNPVGDRNVILTPEPPTNSDDEQSTTGPAIDSFDEIESESEAALRDLVSFRTQFRIFGNFDYVYQIDPNRDNVIDAENAPLQSLSLTKVNGRNLARFPVSDERGYEVVGGYLYGRNVKLTRSGFDFSRQGDRRSKALLGLAPDQPGKASSQTSMDPLFMTPQAANEEFSTRKDNVVQIDPNNYGRRLFEIAPQTSGIGSVAFARGILPSLAKGVNSPSSPSGKYAGVPQFTGTTERSFRKSSAVSRWLPAINRARQAVGVSAEQYPDDVILAFIAVESNGRSNARRTTESGQPSQFNGLLQIGVDNAAFLGRTNTEFLGTESFDEAAGQDAIEHFLRVQERSKDIHDYDPDRLAIAWKGGQGTTKTFNRLQSEGATEEELIAFLDKRWGTDGYVEEFRRARSVWLDPDSQVVEVPEEELEELPVNTFGNPPEDGDVEATRASNVLFARELQANQEQGIDALPSLFRPVRDPEILDQINTFLQDIYQQAFESEKEVEARLRGLTRRRPRVNTLSQVPVQNPQPVDSRIVDTPISRSEVQEGLEAGESLGEIFSQEGRWGQVESQWTRAKAEFNRAGEAINPGDDDGDDT